MSDKNKSLVELKKINLTYNRGKSNAFQALYDVDLKIKKGEFVVVLGPSGSGKSTLLNIMAGLEVPDSGTALIEGVDIVKMKKIERTKFHRNTMGMVFQSYNLISTLSVLNNVAIPQIFINKKKKEREKKAMNLLDRFGIKEQWKKIPTELSGGQQQRIGIARAIINDPPIILADEPVGNLDSASANNVMQIMSDLNAKEGRTVIMVTHNPENTTWGNHVITMKDGKIIKEEWKDAAGASQEIEVDAEAQKSGFEKVLEKFRGLSEKQIAVLMEPLKAKMVTESFLIPYENKQVKSIEENIKMRLSGIYDSGMLVDQLDKPTEEGGTGLDARTARKFAAGIENLIETAKEVFGDSSDEQKAEALLRHFDEDEDINIQPEQKEKIANLIRKRVGGEMSHKEFSELLDIPEDAGGAGLDKRTVQKLLREMDLVLIVGYGLESGKQPISQGANQKITNN